MRLLVLLLVWASACASSPRTSVARTATLWVGGDVHLGAKGAAPLEGLALGAPLVINLEGPIGAGSAATSNDALVNPPDTATVLRRAGVLAAGVDNGHGLDAGPQGLERTRTALLREKVVPLGLTVLTVGGVAVALVQVDLSQGPPPDLKRRLEWVVAAPGAAVVLFHVPSPAGATPDPALRAAVDVAVSAGAHAVLVNGTHALGPVERRGSTFISWGLGAVVRDAEPMTDDRAVLVRLDLSDEGVNAATVTPIRAGFGGRAVRWASEAEVNSDLEVLQALGATPLTRTPSAASF